MYAIFRDGGHQVRASEGETLLIEKRDVEPGTVLVFDKISMIANDGGTKIGAPYLAGASVEAEVVGPAKGDKLIVFKFRRRKHSMRRNGHRQHYTRVRVKSIQG